MSALLSGGSIRSRLTLASVIFLPLICGLLAWSLDQSYSKSLMQSQQRQMLNQTYALIAEAEMDDGVLWLPELMTDDRLNQLSSGSFAVVLNNTQQVEERQTPVWRSLSSAGQVFLNQWQSIELDAGNQVFTTVKLGEDEFFVFRYAVEWEDEQAKVRLFQFVVFEDRAPSERQLADYRHTLWVWLAAIALSLIGLQLLILRWGLRPITTLSYDLARIKDGDSQSLSGAYPRELRAMTDSINQLIEHESRQRERYRNTLADLAHSIKNPVTIIASALSRLKERRDSIESGIHGSLEDISEQNERINQIISYQLTRAVGGSSAPFNKSLVVKPRCEKIVSALQKVYADKHMQVALIVEEGANFRGDEGDLMELLGNLIDNAFKYGRHHVRVSLNGSAGAFSCLVEDDGAGITAQQKQTLLRRGARADTTAPGQGIGLAVVEDIVEGYGGVLCLSDSDLGGLSVKVDFASSSHHLDDLCS
jgi:two-component system, OmpR family, sensor histidine kinase PhoQ